MSESARPDLTELLLAFSSEGGRTPATASRIFALLYDELRRVAGDLMRRERPDHTLQATALVNEAYLRLIDGSRVEWQNRAHFFGSISRRTVQREWRVARMWLRRELSGDGEATP